MKVLCTDVIVYDYFNNNVFDFPSITLNKWYEVSAITNEYNYYIINDRGCVRGYPKCRFKTLKEIRKEKLIKLQN